MRLKLAMLTALLLACSSVWADEAVVSTFQSANEAYRHAQFEEAFKKYEQAAQKINDANVYYNMGNSAFKMNKVGLAILNYERARQLNPRNRDILENLQYVQSGLEYKVEDKRSWFVRWNDQLLSWVKLREFGYALLVVYILLLGRGCLGLILKKQLTFKSFDRFLIICLILIAIGMGLKYFNQQIRQDGVVIEPNVKVHFGPSDDDRVAFRLNEGMQVDVIDKSNDWYRISLVNGEIGWVHRKGLGLV